MILAHYQLAHSIAPNTSSQIRYAIYFRLHAKTHPPGAYRPEAMRNIWLDYEGLKPLVEAARRNGTLHAPVSWNATDAITASMASMAMKPNHQKSASEWGRCVRGPRPRKGRTNFSSGRPCRIGDGLQGRANGAGGGNRAAKGHGTAVRQGKVGRSTRRHVPPVGRLPRGLYVFPQGGRLRGALRQGLSGRPARRTRAIDHMGSP